MSSLQRVTSSDALVDGKYRLLDVIGSGGVGTVYRATHVWTEREVAVKVLHRDLPHSSILRAAFLREARAAVQLEHPNVVDVLDMGEDAVGTTYMVMELLSGPTLRDVLAARGSLTPDETVTVLAPLLHALDKAHQLGIVHKDFKPENVILTTSDDGSVVPTLLDFGVAQTLRDSRPREPNQNVLIGTPQYMSPEQATDQREKIGPQADVWGVGVVWYECLTGRCPFDGETHAEALEAVCHAPLDLDDVPEPHRSLVSGMLERSILKRTPSLSAVRAEMVRLGIVEQPGREDSVTVRLPSSSTRPSRILETLHGVGPFERKRLATPEEHEEPDEESDIEAPPTRSNTTTALLGIGLLVAAGIAAWWGVGRSAQEPEVATQPLIQKPDASPVYRTLETPSATLVQGLPSDAVEEPSEGDSRSADRMAEQAAEETAELDREAAPDQDELEASPEDLELEASPEQIEEPPPVENDSAPASKATAKKPRRPARAPDTPTSDDSYDKLPDLVTEW
jgi:serine/threonine-protein kinase